MSSLEFGRPPIFFFHLTYKKKTFHRWILMLIRSVKMSYSILVGWCQTSTWSPTTWVSNLIKNSNYLAAFESSQTHLSSGKIFNLIKQHLEDGWIWALHYSCAVCNTNTELLPYLTEVTYPKGRCLPCAASHLFLGSSSASLQVYDFIQLLHPPHPALSINFCRGLPLPLFPSEFSRDTLVLQLLFPHLMPKESQLPLTYIFHYLSPWSSNPWSSL